MLVKRHMIDTALKRLFTKNASKLLNESFYEPFSLILFLCIYSDLSILQFPRN